MGAPKIAARDADSGPKRMGFAIAANGNEGLDERVARPRGSVELYALELDERGKCAFQQ